MICIGYNKKINTKEERYNHIEDFNCGEKKGESWWHLNCFKKAMNRDLTEIEKTAKEMLAKAFKIYNNLPDNFKQEEFTIA